MSKYIDITGQRFGRLTVVQYTGTTDNHRQAIWSCVCDCGKTVMVRGTSLRKGEVQSCGCFRSETSAQNIKKAVAGRRKEDTEDAPEETTKDQFNDWWMFGSDAEVRRLRQMFY